MAYIGRAPSIGTFTKQDLTGDGSTTTFTLTNTVGSESAILVSVGGVIQEPKVAYTLGTGGTQIVFTTAPSSTDNVYIHFLGNSVTQNLNNVRGTEFILDADGDTSFTADTDDEIDIQVGGTDRSTIKTTGFHNIDSYKFVAGTGDDLEIYHDGTNSFIANKTGALKLATETSGIAITIGHSTSEVTVADNMTVAGDLTVTGTANFGDTNITNVGSITLDTVIDDGGTITLDSSGDIVLDAAGNDIFFKAGGTTIGEFENESNNLIIKSSVSDADLIIRGNDGGSEISALTFDMSAAGKATFNDQVVVGDGKLVLNSTAVTSTAAELNLLDGVSGLVQADLTKLAAIDATASELNITQGSNNATATTVAAADRVVLNDNGTMVQAAVTDLDTFFSASAKTLTNKTLTTPVIAEIDSGSTITLDATTDIVLDADGGDIFFKDDGTTFGSATNTSGNLIIKSGTTTAATFSGANVTFAGTIGSGAITSTGIVTGTGFTAGNAVLAEAELELLDGLTAGTAIASKVVTTDANIDSTGMRNLTISGELDAATGDFSGAVDVAGVITTSDGMIITTADNTDTLTLTSTDTDASSGPNLRLYRNSHTGSHNPQDGDTLGVVEFEGQNDAGQDVIYSQIRTILNDASDGTEDGQIDVKIMNGGSLNMVASFKGPETVINDASIDHDFRVESNGNANMLFVDGGNDHVNIGTSSDLGGVLNVEGQTVIRTSDNSATLTLVSTDNDTAEGPILAFDRSVADVAAGDLIGTIKFLGEDNAGNAALYHEIQASIEDGTNGGEDGRLTIYQSIAGAAKNVLDLKSGEIVFNQDSADLDFRVESDAGTHALFVDAGNNVVIVGGIDGSGTTPAPTNTAGGLDPVFQLQGANNANQYSMHISAGINSAGSPPRLVMSKSRDNTLNGNTILQTDDAIGAITFAGADGTDRNSVAAEIIANVDGSPGGNDMPGRLSFLTTKDGANSTTEAMRINSAGAAKHASGDDALQGTLTNAIHNFSSAANLTALELSSGHATFTNSVLGVGAKRSAVNSYNLITASTGNGSNDRFNDLEFKVKGDGNVSCDESFTGSGADYSEYFEWSDGNSSDVDRVGISVKLDGNKIVASSGSDDAADIIGVVSGSPVIVGDADGTGTRWTEKYLKDDYGRAVYETYTITTWTEVVEDDDDIKHEYHTDRVPSDTTVPTDATDENKLTVISKEDDNTTDLIRRKLNPDYNSSLTYVARADRKEWDTVGLVGKLRMKKDQKTGTNWIKLRDISDTVEEWLVR